MDQPLQINLRGMPHSDAIETTIRRRVARLEALHPHLLGCRVVIDAAGRHKRRGREFVVKLELRVPRREIVIDHDHNEDLFVALREAFDAARRQLEDHAPRKRGASQRRKS